MCVVIGGRNVACRYIIMGPLGSQDPPDTVPLRLAKWLYILPQVDSVRCQLGGRRIELL